MPYVCKGLVKSVLNGDNVDIISGGISNWIARGIRFLAAIVLTRPVMPTIVKGMPM